LFGAREYVGNPFMKHASLPIGAEHFDRWINIFYATVNEKFGGANAEEAKRRAAIMARTFYLRMSAGKVKTHI
jgi:hemoglobin